jgi:hypothetical protein
MNNPSKYQADKYSNPKIVKKIIKQIDQYFSDCELLKKQPTLTRLLLTIGMSKNTYSKYMRGECEHWLEELGDKMDWARLVVEAHMEEALFSARNPTAYIFHLKCNFGWNDRQQAQITNNNSFDISKLTDEQLEELLKTLGGSNE